jgi:N-acetyl-beta-hexosaminidase
VAGPNTWSSATPLQQPQRCHIHQSPGPGAAQRLCVHVKNVSAAAFGMDGDESYVLDIPASGDAVLVANTPVGALRGLETFSQLFLLTREECHYRIPLVPIHVDSPRWTHRGLLVDTGRDYQSVSKLKAIIETLRCAAVPQPPPMTPHPAGYGCG